MFNKWELKLRTVSDDAIENLPMEDKAAIFFVSGYAGEHSNTNFIILNHLNCCKAVILIYIYDVQFLEAIGVRVADHCWFIWHPQLLLTLPPVKWQTQVSVIALKIYFLNQECQRADLNIF